jgi:hypothetical protein
VQRARDRGRLAVNEDNAAVDLMHAGEDLDQRALAGAVLAADGADFLRADRERDVFEDLVRAKPLDHPFDSKNGLAHRHADTACARGG